MALLSLLVLVAIQITTLQSADESLGKEEEEGKKSSCVWEAPPENATNHSPDIYHYDKVTGNIVWTKVGDLKKNGTIRYTYCDISFQLTQGDMQDVCVNGKWSSVTHICTKNNSYCSMNRPNDLPCNHAQSCYSPEAKCDCVKDCSDSTDELDCEDLDCAFKAGRVNDVCADHKYLLQAQICDGIDDCQDGKASDESMERCQQYHNVSCAEGFVKCNTSNVCVKPDWALCNGYSECGDGSDEDPAFCAHYTCPPWREFKCRNNLCINVWNYCNGRDDCGDGTDEPQDLCKADNFTCPDYAFTCDNGNCRQQFLVCDGNNDCWDNSDEKEDCRILTTCKVPDRISSYFQCNNGRCIWKEFECNGRDNCGDNSDETHCRSCGPDEFVCAYNKCIPLSQTCDGKDNCEDGLASDESLKLCGHKGKASCPTTDHVTCNNTAICLLPEQVCDGYFNCPGKTDEDNDYCFRQDTCPGNSFRCDSESGKLNCIRASKYCDGTEDCDEGDDEPEDCEPRHFICLGDHQFTCDNRRCVPASDMCNGRDDCGDLSDEQSCHKNNIPETSLEKEVWEDLQPEDSFHWAKLTGNEFVSWCYGSLISDKFVVASANCTLELSVTIARLGAVDYDIVEEVYQPEYRQQSLYNNLVLLKLNTTVHFTDLTRPACLPSAADTYTSSLDVHDAFNNRKRNGTVMTDKDCHHVLSQVQNRTYSLLHNSIEQTDVYDSMICVRLHPREYCKDCTSGTSEGQWCSTTSQYQKKYLSYINDRTKPLMYTCDDKHKPSQILDGMPLLAKSTDDSRCSRTLVGLLSFFKKPDTYFDMALVVQPDVFVYTRIVSFLPWIKSVIN